MKAVGGRLLAVGNAVWAGVGDGNARARESGPVFSPPPPLQAILCAVCGAVLSKTAVSTIYLQNGTYCLVALETGWPRALLA